MSNEVAPPAISVGENGLVLGSLDEMYRFAKAVAMSGLAPKGLEKPEACLVAIQMGMEVGMKPMAAVQNIAVINGRPSLWGDAALAVVSEHPKFEYIEETIEGEGDSMVATAELYIVGRPPVIRSFSVQDAKRAGLWGKAGPWQQYPKRMLQMRARSWAMRDGLPGALKGLNIAEEAQDMPARVPVDGEVVGETPKPKGLAGLVASAAAKTPESAPTAAQEPAGDVFSDGVAEDTPEAAEAPEKPTRGRKAKAEPVEPEPERDETDLPPDPELDALFGEE